MTRTLRIGFHVKSSCLRGLESATIAGLFIDVSWLWWADLVGLVSQNNKLLLINEERQRDQWTTHCTITNDHVYNPKLPPDRLASGSVRSISFACRNSATRHLLYVTNKTSPTRLKKNHGTRKMRRNLNKVKVLANHSKTFINFFM